MGNKVGRDLSADLPDVEVTGTLSGDLSADAIGVIRCEAVYSQAMVDADLDAMRRLTSPDLVFTHMSGKRQTREQYLADVGSGRLTYYHIEIKGPKVRVDGDVASMGFVSVLDATAYGFNGTFPMHVTHWFKRTSEGWRIVNRPADNR